MLESRRRFTAAWLLLGIGGALRAQEVEATGQAESALTQLLALPTPAERSERATELARQRTATEWLAAIAAFRPVPAHEAGEHRVEAALWNGKMLERTELFVHVPRTLAPDRRAPLLVMTHGTGGSGEGQCSMWSRVAKDLGMVVVAPSESGDNDGYHYAERERQITLSAIRWAKLAFPIDSDRIYLAGISRGGHLTWDVALRHPGVFAAIAPMIGGPRINPTQAQNNLRYLENIVSLPIRDLQGLKDDPRLIANLRTAFERLAKLGARDAQFVEFPELGHSFDFGAVDWIAWLGNSVRDPAPARVVRLAARPGEGRSFWCDVMECDPAKVKEEPPLEFPHAVWSKLDEEGRRAKVAELLDRHTARVEAQILAPGQIRVQTRHVKRMRLLLTDAMCNAKGQVMVTYNGRKKLLSPSQNVVLLLREFAERVDERFLPTREVILP
ncbi:MAG: PHB depolymerase family esterase [Planctomycetota bacterium]